ncbi:MAG: GNAT family N-acetyltransferase [Bacteroidota bacterium]
MNQEAMDTKEVDWQPTGLANDLVQLLPVSASDFDRLFAVASDPLIWEQHPTKNRFERAVFQGYFDGAVASGTAFLIMERTTGEIAGCTRYYDYKPGESIAIGFTFLATAYWGGAFNKAAKQLLVDYAFRFVDTIYFHIGATNLRSQLATGKIGAVKVRELDIPNNNGSPQLHYEYALRKPGAK